METNYYLRFSIINFIEQIKYEFYAKVTHTRKIIFGQSWNPMKFRVFFPYQLCAHTKIKNVLLSELPVYRYLPLKDRVYTESHAASGKKSNIPAGYYMFKVSNRNIKSWCEICSKLTIKTPERRHWSHSGVFIVNFEHISHLVFLMLTLNM